MQAKTADTGQRRRVGAALLCAAAIGAVVAQLLSSADALFLSRVGGRHLGTAFAVSSAASVALLWGLGAIADRRSRSELLFKSSLLSIGLVVLLVAGLGVLPTFTSAVFIVLGKQVGGALELLLWLVIADRFTAREARKVLPWVVVANGAGATAGAFSVGPLAAALGPTAPLWSAVALLLVVSATARLLMRAPDLRLAQSSSRQSKAPLWSGFAVLRTRPLAAWLAVLVATAGVFAPMMYYALSVTAAAEFTNEVELAGFLGRYRGYVQGAALVAQLVAAPWLSKRLGVGLMLLLAPVGAVVVAFVVGASNALMLIAVAQGATRILDVAIQSPTEQLIQNLLPEELRGRVAGIVGGVAKRSGAILGGLMASVLVVWPLAFHGALMVAAVGWLAVAFVLWRRFPALAVAELSGAGAARSQVDRDAAAGLADSRGLARLRKGLCADSAREQETAVSLLRRLGDVGSADVVAQILHVLNEADSETVAARMRSEVRRALGDGLRVSRDAARRALQMLATTHEDNAHLAMMVLGCASEVTSEGQAALRSFAHDREHVGVEVAMARIGGDSVLDVLSVAGHDAIVVQELRCEIARAQRGVSNEDLEELAERLLRSVARCEDPELQLDALDSVVRAMGIPGESALSVLLGARLGQLASDWRKRNEPALREAALVAMCAGREPEYRTLVQALGDAEERVRRRAETLVREAGDHALEALTIASQSGRARLRIAAVEILADLRPSAAALEALLDRELEAMGTASQHARAMVDLPRGGLVRRRLQERVEEAALAALLTLEALGVSMGLGVVAKRLSRAVSMRSRARALEALDALLPRRIAAEMLGALEGSLDRRVTSSQAIEAELAGTDRLTRDLLVHALGREGRARYRDTISEAAHAAQATADPLALMQRLVSGNGDQDGTVAADVPNLMETIAALSELSLFADLQAVQLEELAAVVQWRHVVLGETLMEQGERASSMFFVRSGQLDVVVKGVTVATLGVGEPVGELGLFSEECRSATVVAASDATLGMVTREDIENLIEDVPGIALRLCRAMSRRLAEANAR